MIATAKSLPRKANLCGRVNLAYGVWAALSIPVLWSIWQQVAVWDIYRIQLMAAALGWTCALRYHYHHPTAPRHWHTPSVVIGILLGLAGAVLNNHSLFIASCLSASSLTVLRMAITRETFRQALACGLLIGVFIITPSVSALDHLTTVLTQFHGNLAPGLLSMLTGSDFGHSGTVIYWGDLPILRFGRECSGATSLLGLMLFALGFSTDDRLGLGTTAIMVVCGVVLAITTNLLRVTMSGIFALAGWAYWVAPAGHERFGLILVAIELLLLKVIARRLELPPSGTFQRQERRIPNAVSSTPQELPHACIH